jgi:DNA-binding NtrC family response regulator
MNILVIDDDEMILLALKKGLENHGHKVTAVENGFEALMQLDENNFDFIICDVFMPELSGFVVANQLKQYSHPIPLIFISSDKQIEQVIRMQYNYEFDFMSKPVSVPLLIKTINEKTGKMNPKTWN